jgi:hypothetical protein
MKRFALQKMKGIASQNSRSDFTLTSLMRRTPHLDSGLALVEAGKKKPLREIASMPTVVTL